MLFSLHTMHLEENTTHWDADRLSRERRHVRRAAVLPLVPLQRVEDVWFNALDDLEDADLPVNITPFADYVTAQWVEGDRVLWNHYDTDGPRTTNNLEGWHGRLERKVDHAHPNIFNIIDIFQAANEVRQLQRLAVGVNRPRAKKYRDSDRRLTELKHRLTTGAMAVITYSDAASHLLHLN